MIDADRVAADAGMAGRINTVMQTCFFAISGVLPREEAIAKIKAAVVATYGRKGAALVEQNFAAIDRTLDNLHEVRIPSVVSSTRELPPIVPHERPRVRAARYGRDDRRPRRRSAGERAAS